MHIVGKGGWMENEIVKGERVKANQVFENLTEKLENETNTTFENSRFKADQARFQRREKTDSEVDEGYEQNSQILSERLAEDRAIKTERQGVDMALGAEREARERVIRNLMDDVRAITNSNFLIERTKTDRDASQSKDLLEAEQLAHSGTKAALTTREEFLAIVSHDLRNPIGTISSSADLLLNDTLFSGLNEDVRNWLHVIKRNADTSLRLISDILDMERIAEDKLGLNVGRHFISEVIHDSIENHQQMALSKSISLKVAENLPSVVLLFDRDRIAQVISNLIGNALKFTPKGGIITIAVEDSADSIQFSVKDTGPGIAADKKLLIFDRYAQIANKDRRGLGLGLYISKMIVDLHHGKLWVISEIKEGSTFYFTLPKT